MTKVISTEEYFKAVSEMDNIIMGYELDCEFGYDPGMSSETEERLQELELIVLAYEEQNPEMLEIGEDDGQ